MAPSRIDDRLTTVMFLWALMRDITDTWYWYNSVYHCLVINHSFKSNPAPPFFFLADCILQPREIWLDIQELTSYHTLPCKSDSCRLQRVSFICRKFCSTFLQMTTTTERQLPIFPPMSSRKFTVYHYQPTSHFIPTPHNLARYIIIICI